MRTKLIKIYLEEKNRSVETFVMLKKATDSANILENSNDLYNSIA